MTFLAEDPQVLAGLAAPRAGTVFPIAEEQNLLFFQQPAPNVTAVARFRFGRMEKNRSCVGIVFRRIIILNRGLPSAKKAVCLPEMTAWGSSSDRSMPSLMQL